MQYKQVSIIAILSVQAALAGPPVLAQTPDFNPSGEIQGEDVTTSGVDYDLDLIDVSDIQTATPANEVGTAQLPSGLLGTVFDLLGPKPKDGEARTINETQRKLLDLYGYGQKALNAYKLGKDIYQAIDNFSFKKILNTSVATVLGEVDELGNPKGTTAAENGGSGADSVIYENPETPDEVYTQARNDEARRALLPNMMAKLVFSEEGQTLIQQQGEQIEQSVTDTIAATQALIGISANSQQQAELGGELAQAVGTEGQKAQSHKSSQAVLKSLAAQNTKMAQGTATNGGLLSNIVAGQEQQKRSTDALVVSNALAHQQRTTGLHLSASELALQEQIRAELEQQKDERHIAQDQASLQEQLSLSGLYIPGFAKTSTP